MSTIFIVENTSSEHILGCITSQTTSNFLSLVVDYLMSSTCTLSPDTFYLWPYVIYTSSTCSYTHCYTTAGNTLAHKLLHYAGFALAHTIMLPYVININLLTTGWHSDIIAYNINTTICMANNCNQKQHHSTQSWHHVVYLSHCVTGTYSKWDLGSGSFKRKQVAWGTYPTYNPLQA